MSKSFLKDIFTLAKINVYIFRYSYYFWNINNLLWSTGITTVKREKYYGIIATLERNTRIWAQICTSFVAKHVNTFYYISYCAFKGALIPVLKFVCSMIALEFLVERSICNGSANYTLMNIYMYI